MNKKATGFSPEVRERAVRLVREQRSEHPSMWAAVESIEPMIGCTPQTLTEWVKSDRFIYDTMLRHHAPLTPHRTMQSAEGPEPDTLDATLASSPATARLHRRFKGKSGRC